MDAILRYAALISCPMRDGVADPSGLGHNDPRILIALSGKGPSAGHDLAEHMRDQRNLRRKSNRVTGSGMLQEKVNVAHRFYTVPASNTAVGHLILENP